MYFEQILLRSFEILPRRVFDALQSCPGSNVGWVWTLLDVSWTPLGLLEAPWRPVAVLLGASRAEKSSQDGPQAVPEDSNTDFSDLGPWPFWLKLLPLGAP